MIMTMEKKLNPTGFGLFRFMNRRDLNTSTISIAQYWDMLTYIDDDYLSDYEVLRMKELYAWQLQELSGQAIAHSAVGYLAAVFLMGAKVKGHAYSRHMRLPVAMSFATFLAVQSSSWERENKTFHDMVSQPAPHGSYFRRTLKENFPVWWHDVSANLYQNGYNLPEMNEYDNSTEIQKSHTQFDTSIL